MVLCCRLSLYNQITCCLLSLCLPLLLLLFTPFAHQHPSIHPSVRLSSPSWVCPSASSLCVFLPSPLCNVHLSTCLCERPSVHVSLCCPRSCWGRWTQVWAPHRWWWRSSRPAPVSRTRCTSWRKLSRTGNLHLLLLHQLPQQQQLRHRRDGEAEFYFSSSAHREYFIFWVCLMAA